LVNVDRVEVKEDRVVGSVWIRIYTRECLPMEDFVRVCNEIGGIFKDDVGD
jgi:hypothetical protein